MERHKMERHTFDLSNAVGGVAAWLTCPQLIAVARDRH